MVNAPRVMENIGAMETANGIRVSAYTGRIVQIEQCIEIEVDVSLEIVL